MYRYKAQDLKQNQNIKAILDHCKPDDSGFCTDFIKGNLRILDLSSNTSRLTIPSESVELNEQTRQRFSGILQRVAREKEGLSRREHIFIQQFLFEVMSCDLTNQ